jgi:hypothetical protein
LAEKLGDNSADRPAAVFVGASGPQLSLGFGDLCQRVRERSAFALRHASRARPDDAAELARLLSDFERLCSRLAG